MGRVCNNLIEELDVRNGHHFMESWLIWRQIVLFRQSDDRPMSHFFHFQVKINLLN